MTIVNDNRLNYLHFNGKNIHNNTIFCVLALYFLAKVNQNKLSYLPLNSIFIGSFVILCVLFHNENLEKYILIMYTCNTT